MSYEDYLGSEHWQELRHKFWLSRLPKSCWVCGDFKRIELHHKYGYARKGYEKLLHLVPLCRTCHQNVHFLSDGTKVRNEYKYLYPRLKSLKRQHQRRPKT